MPDGVPGAAAAASTAVHAGSGDRPGQLDDAAFAAEYGLTAPGDTADVPEEIPSATDTPDGEEAVEATAEDAPEGDADAAEEDATEAVEATPAAKNAPFVVKDKGGDEVETGGVVITYKANGKMRSDPLETVVRLAQSGVYNEKLQADVKESRTTLAEMTTRLADIEAVAQKRLETALRLLKDDDFLMKQREAMEQLNTPEARAQRAEAALRERDTTDQRRTFQSRATAFVDNDLGPALAGIQAAHPELSEQEIWGQFSMNVVPYLVNGIIDPRHYRTVLQSITDDLSPWADQVAEHRKGTVKSVTDDADAKVRKAQEASTRAKRLAAKGTRPAGRPGAPIPARKTTSETDSMEAVMDSIMADVGQSVR